MSKDFTTSTVIDTEFDIVDELKATANDLEKELKESGNKKIIEKLPLKSTSSSVLVSVLLYVSVLVFFLKSKELLYRMKR